MLLSHLAPPARRALLLLLGGFCACSESQAEESPYVSASVTAEAAGSATAGSAAASAKPNAAGSAASPGSERGAEDWEPEIVPEAELAPDNLIDQRAAMLRRMQAMGVADAQQVQALAAILAKSKMVGQGNPEPTTHPMTRSACLETRKAAGVHDAKKPMCKAPFMVPLYRPGREQEAQATTCIDRYEFPNLPCEYPVTWVTTREAEDMCHVIGKRLCDAHEWEGGCAGELLPPEEEYAFGRPRGTMRGMHNIKRAITWAYGAKKNHATCGTHSTKSSTCTASGWKQCGSNTYPAGSFPGCKSPLGVYDQHGNAAEHMALPMRPDQLGKNGGFGDPEMKGSWFIFGLYEAHIDDCRWRAPDWHANEGKNHSNYHLGFRCCKDL